MQGNGFTSVLYWMLKRESDYEQICVSEFGCALQVVFV